MNFPVRAAAVVIAPAPGRDRFATSNTFRLTQRPLVEVNSIIWPNPEFDKQHHRLWARGEVAGHSLSEGDDGELAQLPNPRRGWVAHRRHRPRGSHQANKNMVLTLQKLPGIPGDQIFFNIERVGNTSSASILLAVHDAVQEGRIDRPCASSPPASGRRGGWVRRHAGRPRSGELKF